MSDPKSKVIHFNWPNRNNHNSLLTDDYKQMLDQSSMIGIQFNESKLMTLSELFYEFLQTCLSVLELELEKAQNIRNSNLSTS